MDHPVELHFVLKFSFNHRVKDFPVAQDQAHVATPIGHEAVEVVDDVLFMVQKFQNEVSFLTILSL